MEPWGFLSRIDGPQIHIGNTGCGVFKRRIQKLEMFLAKNQLYSNEITKF